MMGIARLQKLEERRIGQLLSADAGLGIGCSSRSIPVSRIGYANITSPHTWAFARVPQQNPRETRLRLTFVNDALYSSGYRFRERSERGAKMDDTVYVVRCPNYGTAGQKIAELLSMMGGIECYAAPGERIVLKVNLLQAALPDRAVTTHPAVVAAIGREVKRVGARPMVADSPGTRRNLTEATLREIYRTCGMDVAARDAGIELNMDTSHRPVSFPEGKLIKHFNAITPVLEADGIFNLCKLKTHLFMYMTGAVKNHFGIVPGLEARLPREALRPRSLCRYAP